MSPSVVEGMRLLGLILPDTNILVLVVSRVPITNSYETIPIGLRQ